MKNIYKIKAAKLLLFSSLFIQLTYASDKVNLQFVTYPKWTERQPIELFIKEGETIKLKVPSNSLSKTYQVPRLDQWVFGLTTEPENEKTDKATFKAFGQCNSLAAKNQVVLLMRKSDNPEDGLQAIPFDSDIGSFSPGSFFYYNLSTVPIAGRMGKTKFLLKPNTYTIVSLTSEDTIEKGAHNYVYTQVYFKAQNQVNSLLSTLWPAQPKARSMVFFYHDPATMRIKMHSLQDFSL